MQGARKAVPSEIAGDQQGPRMQWLVVLLLTWVGAGLQDGLRGYLQAGRTPRLGTAALLPVRSTGSHPWYGLTMTNCEPPVWPSHSRCDTRGQRSSPPTLQLGSCTPARFGMPLRELMVHRCLRATGVACQRAAGAAALPQQISVPALSVTLQCARFVPSSWISVWPALPGAGFRWSWISASTSAASAYARMRYLVQPLLRCCWASQSRVSRSPARGLEPPEESAEEPEEARTLAVACDSHGERYCLWPDVALALVSERTFGGLAGGGPTDHAVALQVLGPPRLAGL